MWNFTLRFIDRVLEGIWGPCLCTAESVETVSPITEDISFEGEANVDSFASGRPGW